MRSTFLAAFAAISCATGCAHAVVPVSAPVVASAARAAAADSHPTGVGNSFTFEATPSGRLGALSADLTYTDKQGYFAGVKTINAYLRLVTTEGKTLEFQRVQLVLDGKTFKGGTALSLFASPTHSVIASGEVAFFAGDQWDSDQGKNYALTF